MTPSSAAPTGEGLCEALSVVGDLGFLRWRFVLLEENPPKEFVLGVTFSVLKWYPKRVTPEEFLRLRQKCYVKVVMNFQTSETGDNLSLLSTESRVYCQSRWARIPFRGYWFIISRFSALTRIKVLGLIKQEVEARANSP